jgi:hypothetical protein
LANHIFSGFQQPSSGDEIAFEIDFFYTSTFTILKVVVNVCAGSSCQLIRNHTQPNKPVSITGCIH